VTGDVVMKKTCGVAPMLAKCIVITKNEAINGLFSWRESVLAWLAAKRGILLAHKWRKHRAAALRWRKPPLSRRRLGSYVGDSRPRGWLPI